MRSVCGSDMDQMEGPNYKVLRGITCGMLLPCFLWENIMKTLIPFIFY